MDKVINLGIPHIGEQILHSLKTDNLIQCRSVSNTWRILVENVIVKKWKTKFIKACEKGKTEVVKILLEHPNGQGIDFNIKERCDGYTGFMYACVHGHIEVIKLLLDYPERIDSRI